MLVRTRQRGMVSVAFCLPDGEEQYMRALAAGQGRDQSPD